MPIGSNSIAPALRNIDPRMMDVAKIYKPNLGGTLERGFDRIGDFIGSDEGRAALLRSGAATMTGGLGAGITAGANYVTGRHDAADAEAHKAAEEALRARGLDIEQLSAQQRYDLGLMGVANTSDQNRITDQHYRRSDYVDADRNAVQRQGIETQAATTQRGQDIGLQDNREQRGTTERGQDLGFQSSVYGDNLSYLGRDGVYGAAGIGSKGGGAYSQTETKTPAHTEGGFMGFGGTDIPEMKSTVRIPVTPLSQASSSVPSPGAIAALKANPGLPAEFDRKYGPGSSSQYLGGR